MEKINEFVNSLNLEELEEREEMIIAYAETQESYPEGFYIGPIKVW